MTKKNIKEKDVAAEEKPKKKGSFYPKFRIAVIVIAICAIIVSVGFIVKSILDYKKGDDFYNELSDEFYSGGITHLKKVIRQVENTDYNTLIASLDPSGRVPDKKEYNEDLEQSKLRMSKLSEKYGDLFVWLSVPNTNIDYPVVQYTNNSYYLNHAPTGAYLPAGSVFADFRNSRNVLSNKNIVIYGHNLYNGAMFHSVTYYAKKDYFYSHRDIILYGFDGIYKYRVFSIKKVDSTDEYIKTSFTSDDDFLEFAKRMQKRSMYQVDDVVIDKESRILTLSTCTNVVQSERYCLQAVLVEIIN